MGKTPSGNQKWEPGGVFLFFAALQLWQPRDLRFKRVLRQSFVKCGGRPPIEPNSLGGYGGGKD